MHTSTAIPVTPHLRYYPPEDRSQWWRTAGHPPPNTVPLTSTYDSRAPRRDLSQLFALPYGKDVRVAQTK